MWKQRPFPAKTWRAQCRPPRSLRLIAKWSALTLVKKWRGCLCYRSKEPCCMTSSSNLRGPSATTVCKMRAWLVCTQRLTRPPIYWPAAVTQYSGITAAMMEPVTATLADVHAYLLANLPCNAILAGHSLEFDLHALKVCSSWHPDYFFRRCYTIKKIQVCRVVTTTSHRHDTIDPGLGLPNSCGTGVWSTPRCSFRRRVARCASSRCGIWRQRTSRAPSRPTAGAGTTASKTPRPPLTSCRPAWTFPVGCSQIVRC